MRQLNRVLVPRRLSAMPLHYGRQRALIYLYRPGRLRQDLRNEQAEAILRSRGYDPETNTLTWLMRVTPSLPASLTERPLTVMLDALVLGGEPLTDHPAIVTFQPVNNARTVSGACEDGETGVSFQVVLSPLALLVNARGERYEEFGNGAIYEVLTLVYTDGSAVPVVELASNGGAGHGGDMDGVPRSSTTMRFDELLDITDVRAVRIDGVEIPLS